MNLKEIARLRGTNLKRVAEECDVPPSTLYAISSGDTNFDNVGIGLFIKIADALHMSPEELYGREPASANDSSLLSPDEEALLEYYRRMPPDMRGTIMATAENFAALSGSGHVGGGRAAEEPLTSAVF